MAQLVGKVMRKDAEVIIVFKVRGKFYAATDSNQAIFDAYLHTGNPDLLDKLEHELETT